MKCFRCSKPATWHQRYSGRHLCDEHLSADVEHRAKRVIRQNRWLASGDRIGIVCGLPASPALSHFLEHLVNRRNDICIMPVDLRGLPAPGDWCSWHDLHAEVISCDRLTRLALAWCAEDIAGETLCQILSGDADSLLSPCRSGYPLPLMQPFREIPASELQIYSRYHGLNDAGDQTELPDSHPLASLTPEIRQMGATFSASHPSAIHALRRYRDALRVMAGNE